MQNRTRNAATTLALVMTLLAVAPAISHAVVLYDASLGTTPSAQGWALGFFPAPPLESVAGGALSFESSLSGSAGYVKFPQVLLNADAGYRLAFELRIESGSSASTHRAPFSLTAVSANTNQAIEIGIDTASVFSQDDSPLFERGESTPLDTMSSLVLYELLVHGSTYELLADSTTILSGALRDYTAFMGFVDPYETPNFLFFGDNTSSSGGAWELTTIELTDLPRSEAPEPSTLALVLLGAVAAVRRRR